MRPTFLPTRPLKLPLTLVAAALTAAGCGNANTDSSDAATGTTPTAPIDSAADPGASATPIPAPADPANLPLPVAGDPDGQLVGDGTEDVMLDHKEVTEEDACGAVELVPEEIVVEVPHEITTTTEVLQPVAFYIVLDNSSSMTGRLPGVEDDFGGGNGNDFGGGNDDDDDNAPTPDPDLDTQAQELPGTAGAAGTGGAPGAAGAAGAAVGGAPTEPVTTAVPTQTTADARNRWELAVGSLQEFATSPAAAGVDVAIQYFNPPREGGGMGGGLGPVPDVGSEVCDGSFHANPDVPMGRLPDNAQALIDSLDAADPNGYTPTVGALTGGVSYCEEYQAANPEGSCVVVLVTDGLPHACGLCQDDPDTECFDPNAEATLVPIVAAGAANGVKTFTVAMDGIQDNGFALLDAIAVAGGTDCTPPEPGGESCNVSSTGSSGLVDTLIAIRESVTVTETVTEVETVIEHETLECQWLIPTPPADQGELNPDRVNVQVALDGVNPEFILGVASEADCAATGGAGWYYDNPAAPTQIFACPGSCEAIQSAEKPTIQILLGCARKVPDLMK